MSDADLDLDDTQRNAIEILSVVKRGTGRFVEASHLCVRCECPAQRRLIRVFRGNADDAAGAFTWFLASATRVDGQRNRAHARVVGAVAGGSFSMYASCDRCKRGVIAFTAGAPEALRLSRKRGDVAHVLIGVGIDPSTDWAAGDQSLYVEGADWRNGPDGSSFLFVSPPTSGSISGN